MSKYRINYAQGQVSNSIQGKARALRELAHERATVGPCSFLERWCPFNGWVRVVIV